MKITKAWLKDNRACNDGYGWFIGKKFDSVDIVLLIDDFIADQHSQWAMWVLGKALQRVDLVRMAVLASEQVIDLYEKKYPADDLPRKAIDAAKAYIANPSQSAAAYAAADAMKTKILRYGAQLASKGNNRK